MEPQQRAATAADVDEMLARYETWVFDCDGTLWKGNQLIPGVKEALQLLRDQGKQLLFVTNNSTKSRKAFKAKFDALGLPATQEEIYSSSYGAAAYLKSIGFDKKVYVAGEQGIVDELAAAGIASVGGPDHNGVASGGKHIDVDPEVGAVVCGADSGLSYYKVTYASLCLLHNAGPDTSSNGGGGGGGSGNGRGGGAHRGRHGCLFVATNTDARGHFIATQEWPGAGATVAAVQAVTGVDPFVTGKPSTFMLTDVCRTHNTRPEKMIMVGDRLDTDIAWGHATGMATLLVLTGVVSAQDLAAAEASPGFQRADYLMPSFGDLLAIQQQAAAATPAAP